MRHLSLDLHDIQGDILEGLPKNYENFIFFKIVSPGLFKQHLRQRVIRRIINALQVHDREQTEQNRTNRAPFVACPCMTPSSISCDGHGAAPPCAVEEDGPPVPRSVGLSSSVFYSEGIS